MSNCWMSDFGASRGKKTAVNQIWNVEFGPTSLEEIAVHKAKIASLQETLEYKLKNRTSPFLLLIGPSGCGKTTALNFIAKKLGVSIQEWINSVDIPFITDNENQFKSADNMHESQTNKFSEFLFRANRYKGLNFSKTLNDERIFLVKDFPNSFLRNPIKFFEIIKRYSTLPKTAPCVFVIADNGVNNFKKTLFPDGMIKDANIEVLKFNPIASTAMLRALQNIIKKVPKSSNFKNPSKEELEEIAEASNGDVRSAVNSLQFTCLKSSKKPQSLSLIKRVNLRGEKSSKKLKLPEERSIGSKDENLTLFRILGKILHNKRLPEFNSIEEKLPEHLNHHKRALLSFDPDAMFDKSFLGADAYLASLHQNYIGFSNNIDLLSLASDYLSEADTLMHDWSTRPSLASCQTSLITRGVLFSLSNADKSGWKPLYKPATYNLLSKITKAKEELLQHFYLVNSNVEKLAMEILPFYANIGGHNLSSEQIRAATKISRFGKTLRIEHEKLEDGDLNEHEQQLDDFHFSPACSSTDIFNTNRDDVGKEDFYIEDIID